MKQLQNLETALKSGEYYEALQMYHSVCQRLLKKQKVDEAAKLLQEGAMIMLDYRQYQIALDLIERMLKLPITFHSDVFVLLFLKFDIREDACDKFVDLVLKNSKDNHKELCHIFGSQYYRRGLFYDAEAFLVQGVPSSAIMLGDMIFEWAQQGQHADYGYFLTRAVVLYLARGAFKDCEACIQQFFVNYNKTEKVQGQDFRDIVYYETRMNLLNFAQVIVQVCKYGDQRVFDNLLIQYEKDLNFDHSLVSALKVLSDEYFSVKSVNPFSSMMNSLFQAPSRPSLMGVDLD